MSDDAPGGEDSFPEIAHVRGTIADAALLVHYEERDAVSLAWQTSCEGKPPGCDPEARRLIAAREGDVLTLSEETDAPPDDRPALKIRLRLPRTCALDFALGAAAFHLAGEFASQTVLKADNGAFAAAMTLSAGSLALTIANAGAANFRALPGSSFRYTADTGLGPVIAPGGPDGTVGEGAGRLSLSLGTGPVTILAD